MSKAQRVARLLEIVTLLQTGEGWTARRLAERFGISRTRIFDDLRALREAGIPVRTTRAGYRIDPSFFLPSVQLTPHELLALLSPGELFADGPYDHEVLRSARSKLLCCLPEELQAGAAELLHRTSVAVPTADVQDEDFETLRKAVSEHRRVVVLYESRTSPPRTLEFDPYGLAYRRHAWYCVGYSVAHGEVRKLRVSRIRSIELTALHFPVPDDFSVDEQFTGAWLVFGGEPQEVVLRFSGRVARYVRERPPLPGRRIQPLGDGAILFRAEVNSLDEVAWWLVQYGGDVTVVRPDALRAKVVGLAEGILAANAAGRRPYAMPGEGAEPRAAEPDPSDDA